MTRHCPFGACDPFPFEEGRSVGELTRHPRMPIGGAKIPGFTPSFTRLSLVQWLICGVAALGFAFDLYEILILPLIVRPALVSLGGPKPGTPAFNHWVGLLFYVPLAMGGIFGLLGGYLTDLFGRRRVL